MMAESVRTQGTGDRGQSSWAVLAMSWPSRGFFAVETRSTAEQQVSCRYSYPVCPSILCFPWDGNVLATKPAGLVLSRGLMKCSSL